MPNISAMLTSFWERDVKIPSKKQIGIHSLQLLDCLILLLECKCDILNFLPKGKSNQRGWPLVIYTSAVSPQMCKYFVISFHMY